MERETVLFGLACLSLCGFVRRDDVRLWAALALSETWAVANLAWYLDILAILPVLDVMVALIVLPFREGRRWVDVIVAAAAVRLLAHVSGAFGLPYPVYAIVLNIGFATMLLAVAARGMWDAASRLGDSLSDRFRRYRVRARQAVAADA